MGKCTFLPLVLRIIDRDIIFTLQYLKTWFWTEDKKLLFFRETAPAYNHITKNPAIVLSETGTEELEKIIDFWPADFSYYFHHKVELRKELEWRFRHKYPCFTAYIENKLAGIVWCKPWLYENSLPELTIGKQACEILNLAVSPEMRGKGIAVTLLQFSLEEINKKNTDIAFSRIFSNRTASISAHKKCGFTLLGELRIHHFLKKKRVTLETDHLT
ncbi:MAG: GNAT family N-acetyltransferase [Fibrobacter sp.]|nr:GNAT family N-acetyltransferase [Fibrobacter sp.]